MNEVCDYKNYPDVEAILKIMPIMDTLNADEQRRVLIYLNGAYNV